MGRMLPSKRDLAGDGLGAGTASSQSSGLGRGLGNSCGVRMPTHSKLLLFLHKEIRESVLVLIDFKKKIIRIVMGS